MIDHTGQHCFGTYSYVLAIMYHMSVFGYLPLYSLLCIVEFTEHIAYM